MLYLTTLHKHKESPDKDSSPLDSEMPSLSNQSSPSPSPGPSPPALVELGLDCQGSFPDRSSSFYSGGTAAEEVLVRGAAPEHEIEIVLNTMISAHRLECEGDRRKLELPRAPERAQQGPSGREMGFCAAGQGESLAQGVPDRLSGLGLHTRGGSHSGPPIAERVGVLDREPAFQTEPSGNTPFACIFMVQIPKDDNTGVPLTRLGRPLVPDTIATDRLTVVATYHPSCRHLVVDVLDYCHCPAGFESTQIADLIYLQNNGYMPSFCAWPMQSYSSERYQVASQWSLCTTNANGQDVLCVSDVDVLVQRVAGCMYRVNETRHVSRGAHRRHMSVVLQSCSEVELFSKVSGLWREPMYAAVPMDFYRDVALEWMTLGAQPGHQLPHSRFGMPIRSH